MIDRDKIIVKETCTSAMSCGHIVPVYMLGLGCEEVMETVIREKTVTMYNRQLRCPCTNVVHVKYTTGGHVVMSLPAQCLLYYTHLPPWTLDLF